VNALLQGAWGCAACVCLLTCAHVPRRSATLPPPVQCLCRLAWLLVWPPHHFCRARLRSAYSWCSSSSSSFFPPCRRWRWRWGNPLQEAAACSSRPCHDPEACAWVKHCHLLARLRGSNSESNWKPRG